MTMTRLDSLLHRPRPMRVVLQKFFVVIGLDHERLHVAQSFDDHLGRVTKVSNEPETTATGVKSEPKRINSVVWYGKRLHGYVADRKLGAGRKDSPGPVSLE